MLERVRRKGNPLTLLMGTQTGTATKRTMWRFLKKLGTDCLVLCCAQLLQLCLTLCSLWSVTRQAPVHGSPGKNTGVGCRALLQGIFPTQGLKLYLWCLLH